ncbi:nucleotidyltransferase domain-containing protein [Streptomyces sp. NPDC060194]|uniref:nucleotidyltransferase domain-containing protein n=1 Tax=Streptomyces sp. NPDC060194 TaxID=3347069 RepID=UPI0036580FCB
MIENRETDATRALVAEMASRLTAVRGVRAVALGGSRARGTHRPDSDWDLGLYYRGEPDVPALTALAEEFTGGPVEVAGPGGWGPWVDGGAWLRVGGVAVDWILRDLDRVEAVWAACVEGRYEVGVQAGHPLGFWSPVYAGEVALGRVLADPFGELAPLRQQTLTYPPALRAALVHASWEAEFLLAAARKDPDDPLYASLCVSRALGILAQSMHAHHRAWLLNEKGALASAARLPVAPDDFSPRVARALAGPGREALDAAAELVAEVRARLEAERHGPRPGHGEPAKNPGPAGD